MNANRVGDLRYHPPNRVTKDAWRSPIKTTPSKTPSPSLGLARSDSLLRRFGEAEVHTTDLRSELAHAQAVARSAEDELRRRGEAGAGERAIAEHTEHARQPKPTGRAAFRTHGRVGGGRGTYTRSRR